MWGRSRICLLAAAGALVAGCSPSAPDVDVVEPERPTLVNIDRIDIADGRGLYVARRDSGETRIAFDLPAARLAPERRHDMEQIGDTPGGVVVVLDRYASRPVAGGRCMDGREAFVRVFSLSARRELMARPVESCLDGLAPGDPPVRWLGDGRFRVEGATPATFAIEGTDRVTEVARG